MKRLHFRRKTLLRALRIAALAFLCWIGVQRAVQAQTVLGPGSFAGYNSASGNYLLDAATFLSTSSTGFSGAGTRLSSYSTFNLGGGALTIDSASSVSYQYLPTAVGVFEASLALGSAGNATIENFGAISATGNSGGMVQGVSFSSSSGSSLSFTNQSGATISGTNNGHATGSGIYASTTGLGQITVNNNGTGAISGSSASAGGAGTGVGIYVTADGSGQITINNTDTGSISGAGHLYGFGYGVYAGSISGQITINNTGGGGLSGSGRYAYGINANTNGDILITNLNSGTIVGTGLYRGFGIDAFSGSGSVNITNAGTIQATGGNTGSSYGILANAYASSLITNTGHITASNTSGNSYGIFLIGSPGAIYNTGSITAGTDAIFVPSGSLVTLAGASNISGLIKGGSNAASTSTLNFSLSIPTAGIAAAKSLLDAAIASYNTSLLALGAGASATNLDGTVTLNGITYTFEDFGTIIDGIAGGTTYAAIPGYNSLGASLDNLSISTNPNAITLLNALGTISAANIPAALAQLSPAKTSQQFLTQPVTQATFQNLELGQRLALVRSGFAGGADWSGLQFVDAQDPLLSQIKSQLYAYNPVSTPGEVSDTAAPLSTGDQFARWGTFLTGNAVLTNQSATANQNHADSTTVDITAGADYHLNRNWAVGFLFGYGRTNASVDDNGSRAGDDQYRFGPYAGYSQGPWFANANANFAFNEESSTRVIPFLGQQATAHPSGTQYGAEADGGYEFKAVQNKLVYGPTASLQYTHLDIDSYTETGSAADLSIASQHEDSLQSGLGGKASYDAKWSWNGAILRPDLHGSWLHEFMANNDTVNAAFDIPGAQSFSTTFQKQQRDSGLVGCGVQNIFKGGSLLFVNYDAQVGVDNFLAQSISGGLKIVF